MAEQTPKRAFPGLVGAKTFAELRPETVDRLQAMCRVKTNTAGQVIAYPQEETDFIGCVLSGVLRMQKALEDGREHIVGLLVEGDIFGRVFDGAAEFSIEAATDVEYCSFPRTQFESLLAQSPDLERAILLNTTNELDRARQWLIILSHQRIVGRIAGFLLLMCSRFHGIDHILQPRAEGIEIKIPISRNDLANLLGARPETISRSLHALSDKGDIDILEPDRILIRDIKALAQAADEDETATFDAVRDLFKGGISPEH
jgi:CRP/FNR family transcriptional regulator